MYTLRIILEDGVESNQCLGDNYNVIDKEQSPIEFKEAFDNMFKGSEDAYKEFVYKFVVYNDGSVVRPLYNNQLAYIMLNGKTVDNLSNN